jgi:hypothetical protein
MTPSDVSQHPLLSLPGCRFRPDQAAGQCLRKGIPAPGCCGNSRRFDKRGLRKHSAAQNFGRRAAQMLGISPASPADQNR